MFIPYECHHSFCHYRFPVVHHLHVINRSQCTSRILFIDYSEKLVNRKIGFLYATNNVKWFGVFHIFLISNQQVSIPLDLVRCAVQFMEHWLWKYFEQSDCAKRSIQRSIDIISLHFMQFHYNWRIIPCPTYSLNLKSNFVPTVSSVSLFLFSYLFSQIHIFSFLPFLIPFFKHVFPFRIYPCRSLWV